MNYPHTVDDVSTLDFPFVSSLPKREKTKVKTLWDSLVEFRALIEQHGPPVSHSLAAKLLGVSRQRVYELCKEGRFIEISSPDGRSVITANSLVEFAKQERKAGRPTKLETSSMYQLMKAGMSPEK
jgi:Helix-turn-helix domain